MSSTRALALLLILLPSACTVATSDPSTVADDAASEPEPQPEPEPDAEVPPAPTSDGGCTAGASRCPKGCADLQKDPRNCGSCGNVCEGSGGATGVCVKGECRLQCPKGQSFCDGTCVDLQTNDSHCGACHESCSSFGDFKSSCVAGRCDYACKEPGLTRCGGKENPDGSVTLGTCADTKTHVAMCGSCSRSCLETAKAYDVSTAHVRCVDSTCKGPAHVEVPVACPSPSLCPSKTCEEICVAAGKGHCEYDTFGGYFSEVQFRTDDGKYSCREKATCSTKLSSITTQKCYSGIYMLPKSAACRCTQEVSW